MAATCKQCIDLLVDYVDGVLETDLREKLDGHLHDCGACDEFLTSYRATTTLCKRALAREMPESLANKLHSFLHEKCAKPDGEGEG